MMKKITYGMGRLAMEFKALHKPGGKMLIRDTVRIMGSAACAAAILKAVDTGFAALLGLVL